MSKQEEQQQPAPENSKKEDEKASMITSLLANKDPLIQLVTLVLILFTGAGNFFATSKAENRNVDEINRALDEIHYIRARIDYFETRQIDMSNRIKAIDEHTVDIQDKLRRLPTP